MRQSLRRHRQLPPATPPQYSSHNTDAPSVHLASVQNYFTILHHLYGRKHSSKPLLKIQSPQSQKESDEFAFSERLSKLGDSPSGNRTGNSSSKTKKKYSQQPLVGEVQRKNWKNSILRRKNNGSHGQIIRGFAHNRHNSVLQRAHQPQLEEIKNSLMVNTDKEVFIPLGTIHQQRPRVTHYEDLHIRRKNKDGIISELKRTRKMKSQGDEMARTYAPSRFNSDNNFIRRVNLNSPVRKEKLLSPWEVITQR